MRQRVLLGMSGGVDSSVAAALLLRAGYDVIGITMKMWPQDCLDREQDKACGPFAMVDARAVAERLGFPHYVIDEQAAFQKRVIDHFVAEYRAGRTPNPCVVCNEHVKFGALLDKAHALGANSIATGHYARVIKNGRAFLKCSLDPQKDQTYFLFSRQQEQLQRVLFPLGEMNKTQTRALAAELGLKVATKKDSQEVCFVPEHDYRRFLREETGLTPREGEIVDHEGSVLGHHAGIEYFTIGQRKGLGITGPQPYYVVGLDATANRVIVGAPDELMTTEFYIERPNWIAFDKFPSPAVAGEEQGEGCDRAPAVNDIRGYRCTVKIRSQHPGCPATITFSTANRILVTLDRPERAVTPGQAAVFYDGDLVLGGGWICGQ